MNWITDTLAVGDWQDFENSRELRKLRVTPFDIRNLFDEEDEYFEPADVDAAVRSLSPDDKYMIFCDAGMDRAPFIAAVYLVTYNGLTFREAYDKVKAGRPQTIEHWEWVDVMEDFWDANTEVEPHPEHIEPVPEDEPEPVEVELEPEDEDVVDEE